MYRCKAGVFYLCCLAVVPNLGNLLFGPDNNQLSAQKELETQLSSPSPAPKPRFLWGIFTMDSHKETQRRQMIRDTYLSYYSNQPALGTLTQKICSLPDYRSTKINTDKCQIVYTFVMGSNPAASPDLSGVADPNFPLVTNPPEALLQENDVVHLNIKENMNEGKTPSWFKYGVALADSGLYFDYISKCDTDTLIFPEKFFQRFNELNLPLKVQDDLVFGGYIVDGQQEFEQKWLIDQGGKANETKYWMNGSFYFMSLELARHVSYTYLNRDQLEGYKYLEEYYASEEYHWPQQKGIGHEDLSMANYVYSHPKGPKAIIKAVFGEMYPDSMSDIGLHKWGVTKDVSTFLMHYQQNVQY